MSGFEALQAASGGLYLLTTTVIGLRLLYLAWRNRGAAELMLGGSLLLGGLFGAACEVAASRLLQAGQGTEAGALMLVAKTLGGAGIALYAWFVWRVFRPTEGWAGVVFACIAVNIAVSIAGFALAGTFATGVSSREWFCFELIGRLASPVWMVFEAFRYHAQMQRRVSLGLADPLVANRFLLWGVGGCFGILMLLTSIPPAFVSNDHPLMPFTLLALGISGVGASIPYWFAFFPPAAYRARFVAATA